MADDPLFWVVMVSVLAVVGVLMWGIGSFGKGGEYNRKNANKIMRWRIGAQAFAILMILTFIYLRGGGN